MSQKVERAQWSLEAQRRRVCALADAAEVHRSRAGYRKAESLLRQALAIAVKALGSKDLVIATLLNNLAVVHKFQGRFTEASRLYRRALPLLEQALGPEHPEVATVYHNLGISPHVTVEDVSGRPAPLLPSTATPIERLV